MLMKNDIICTKTESTEEFERILFISEDYKECITIKMNVDELILKKKSINDIQKLYDEGICKLHVENFGLNNIIEAEISQSRRDTRDMAYEIIKYIFEQEDEIVILSTPGVRSNVIKKASKEFSISIPAIYKYLRLYLQGGKLKNALLPKFNSCGAKGKKKKYKKKSGRKSCEEMLLDNRRGVILDDDIRNKFRISIDRYYNNTKERSLAKAYELMLGDFFSKKNDDGKKELYEPSKIPTFRQFEHYYYNNRNLETVYKNRKGNKKFDLTCRPLKSDSTYETFGPGFRFQIDATMADVYLVSRFDNVSVIGRPILYLVVDVFSRLIVGFFVGLEGPSWNGAASAIYNCTEDKVELCKKYGIGISRDQWPSRGLPEILMADRGELVGPIANDIVALLGISIENTPSYRGDAKGIVERNFRSVNDNIKHWTPGAVKKDYRERGERRYELDAKLNIDDYTKIIIYSILERNNSYLESYPLSKEMIEDNVEPIPTRIWEWGLKNKTGYLHNAAEDLLKESLLRSDRATITESGIKFKKALYLTKLENEKDWYLKARTSGYERVDVLYDNRDMSVIYMKDKNSGKLIPCYLKKENSSCFNRTYEEIEDYNFNNGIRNKNLDYGKLNNAVIMNDGIKNVIKDAERRSSGKVNIKNIKDNRREENSTLRKEQSLLKRDDFNNEIYFSEKDTNVVNGSRNKYRNFIHRKKKKG